MEEKNRKFVVHGLLYNFTTGHLVLFRRERLQAMKYTLAKRAKILFVIVK